MLVIIFVFVVAALSLCYAIVPHWTTHCDVMIEIVSSVSVYLVFLLLPGALNSLVTRFKTHFVSRVTLLVVGSSLLFLLDCHSRSIRSMSVVFIDGLSSLSSNLLIYEVLLIFIALSVIGIGNLGVGVCALGGLT